MKYRAEIDGLRALAVLPVILFHAGVKWSSGGFVGVDVFFVISGYLITTILINDLENNRYSLMSFYERRARRILPALYVVCLCSLIAAWVTLDVMMLRKFGNSLIGVGTFSSNIVFWKSGGYFAESMELHPLLHSWSLAVEEQYYVLFPLFLFLSWRLGRTSIFWMIVGLAVISLAISEWGWRNYPSANFYLAPSRAWELLAGSISAFVVQKRGVQSSNIFSLIGFLAVVFALLTYDEFTPFPSLYTLVPVTGVVLLVLFAGKNTLVGRFLAAKVFVGIGLVSYSAYLWHQPLLAYTRLYLGSVDLEPFVISTVLLVTGGLSYFTWRYVEVPFRSRQFLSTSSALLLSVLVLSSLLCLGFISRIVADGAEDRLARELASSDFIYYQNMDERKFNFARLGGHLRPVKTLVVGSSRVMQVGSLTLNVPVLNLSVSGASIEDHIAFSAEAIAQYKPNRIIIGLDPWLLNQNDDQERWRSINSLYVYWQANIRKDNELGGNDVSYFFKNKYVSKPDSVFYRAYKKINIVGRQTPMNGDAEAIDKKHYDGSHIYNRAYANRTDEAITADFDILRDYSMNEYELDLVAEKKLLELVSWAQMNGVKVIFVLPPYHPNLYSMIADEKQVILDIEKRFRDLARKYGVELVGSYDPRRVGCSKSEFYDGMHPKLSCMTKVFLDLTK